MSETPYSRTEIAIGLFVIAGLGALAYLSASIGGVRLLPDDSIRLKARFASVGALKTGAAVKIAGVRVGYVDTVSLADYAAETELAVEPEVQIPADTIASIRTEGLLGESYVLLRPGGSDKNLATGERIGQTEPAVDLIDLVVKYALEKNEGAGKEDDADANAEPFEN